MTTRPSPPLDTNFNVPVRVWIPQPVFKAVQAKYGDRTPEFLSRVVQRALTRTKARNIDKAPRKPRLARTPELIDQVLALHREGLRSVVIAERVGFSQATVSRILHEHELTPHGSWRG